MVDSCEGCACFERSGMLAQGGWMTGGWCRLSVLWVSGKGCDSYRANAAATAHAMQVSYPVKSTPDTATQQRPPEGR